MCCFRDCVRLPPPLPWRRLRSVRTGGGGVSAQCLVEAGLDRAKREGWQGVAVLGDPAWYRRFGFRPEAVQGMASPYAGPALMGLALAPGGLSGPRIEHRARFRRPVAPAA